MKRKSWALLFGLAITIGLTNYPKNGLWRSSLLAQPAPPPAPSETSLEPMDIERLDAILKEQVEDITAQPNQWRFSINEIPLIVVADPNANRMRIFSPVTDVQNLTSEQIQKMMLANFHTALDARYAIANGSVVSTFIHPLSSLQEQDLLSALNQVSSLAATFGTSYTSGELLFVPRGNGENPPPPPIQESSQDDIQARKSLIDSQLATLGN